MPTFPSDNTDILVVAVLADGPKEDTPPSATTYAEVSLSATRNFALLVLDCIFSPTSLPPSLLNIAVLVKPDVETPNCNPTVGFVVPMPNLSAIKP